MEFDPHIHHRRSIRRRGQDYARAGAYFITLCAENRKSIFGQIRQETMQLYPLGHAAVQCWETIPSHFPHVRLDSFVVMPNHLHGILFLDDSCQEPPLPPNVPPVWPPETKTPSRTIGSIVRGFKIGVTKWAKQHTSIQAIWQRDYFDRVLRDQEELVRARNYIANNPLQWAIDKDNPECRP
ncbi:MAG: hypothetical protein HN909_05780 [Phycisphaerales bacterium]|jgi:putative transposase|nr:hypothetical protein [Phycisphaerales bacterium]MBT7171263.1 hypothetical protein [Phycisphaerales bacterium]